MTTSPRRRRGHGDPALLRFDLDSPAAREGLRQLESAGNLLERFAEFAGISEQEAVTMLLPALLQPVAPLCEIYPETIRRCARG